MEDLFKPFQRLQDQSGFTPVGYTEVELAVPIQAFLDHHWDWSALLAFATTGEMRKILWITEDTFISTFALLVGAPSNQGRSPSIH
jgi:hypothetical protein